MKNVILILLVFFGSISGNAQKNEFTEKRADVVSAYIASEMNLSKDQTTFLRTTLFDKYSSNSKKIRGKNLSQDEKQEIYRAGAAAGRKVLSTQFSNAEVKQIIALEQKKQKEENNN